MGPLSIQDLVSQDSAAIDRADLQNKPDGVPLSDNNASQLAATEALLHPNSSVQDYQAIKADLLSADGQQNFILQQQQRRNNIVSGFTQNAGDVITTSTLPDEQKIAYVKGVRSADLNYQTNSVKQLFEAGTASTSSNETEQVHNSKIDLMDIASKVEDQKRQAMAAINALHLESQNTTTGLLKNFADLMTPFSEWIHIDRLSRKLDPTDPNRAIMMGSQKAQLFKQIEQVPVEKRAAFTEHVIQMVKDNPNLIFPGSNNLESMDILQKMLIDNDYSNTDKWIDNATNVLDAIGVGGLVAGAKKVVTAGRVASEATEAFGAAKLTDLGTDATKLEKGAYRAGQSVSDAMANARAKVIRSDVKPTAPAQIMKDANPDAARAMHDMVATDATGDAAKPLYGTTKEEALGKDLLPEPKLADGVDNKVVQHGPQFPENAWAKEVRTTDGQTYVTAPEMTTARAKVADGLENIDGMHHPESMTIELNDDGSTTFTTMYRPMDSGYKTAEQALQSATRSFAHYGATPEDFTLYARQGDKWVETTQQELAARKALRDQFVKAKKRIPDDLKDIDYAVGFKYNWKMHPDELSVDKLFTVKRNLLDYLPPGWMARNEQGSLTQHLFDAASVLDKQIVNPASVAVDKSVALHKAYLDSFKPFVEGYKGLNKERRFKMADYINDANFNGIKFDPVDLKARGFSDAEITTLQHWREGNDTMWYGANSDMVKTLRSRGFKVFVDNANDTTLVVRPVGRGAVSERTHFYNSATDAIENLTKEQLDKVYEDGGQFAKLSEPMQLKNGQWIDTLIVPSNGEQYLRNLKDEEKVLNYRDGYYPVMYDANFFLQRSVKLADGTMSEAKTVASAKHRKDGVNLLERMQQEQPDANFELVPERARKAREEGNIQQGGWNIGVSSGLSMQRVRGEQLADAGVNFEKMGKANLVDPLEAIAQQTRQLSTRISMRDYLDTMKNRWIQQYGKDLELPKDMYGSPTFPSKITDIKSTLTGPRKNLADARTMFNYVHHLENGYINTIDNEFKALMNWGADLVSGDSNLSKAAEGFLRDFGATRPTSEFKGAVFKLFLAANPLRQLIIQAHQDIQLLDLAPKYFLGPLQMDMYRIGKAARGATDDAEAMDMLKELRRSGMLQAVDSNNLVRQDAMRLADLNAAQKIGSAVSAPLRWSQRLGFDTAEQSVLVTSWLVHRHLFLEGLKTSITRRQYDEIAGQARAFTYNMNRAGDMPYNQNSLNVVFQFLQVPHKAFLQPLTNRSLSPVARAQLLAFNGLMYGVPAGLVGNTVLANMQPGVIRDSLVNGLEDTLLNALLTTVSGVKQNIDFAGSLSPYNITNMGDFIRTLATGQIGKSIVNAPASSLFFGGNPRLTEAFKTTMRYFHFFDDYKDPKLDTKLSDVAIAACSLFSGCSNAFKARYAMKTGQAISSLGNITDADVTKLEAAFMEAGFQTRMQSGARQANQDLQNYQGTNGASWTESDVRIWYNELKRQLARRDLTVRDQDLAQRVLNEGLRVFSGPYEMKFRESLNKMLLKDLKQDGSTIYKNILSRVGIQTPAEVRAMVNKLPDSELSRQINQQLDNLEKAIQNGQ